jgi:hypothetical protein
MTGLERSLVREWVWWVGIDAVEDLRTGDLACVAPAVNGWIGVARVAGIRRRALYIPLPLYARTLAWLCTVNRSIDSSLFSDIRNDHDLVREFGTLNRTRLVRLQACVALPHYREAGDCASLLAALESSCASHES